MIVWQIRYSRLDAAGNYRPSCSFSPNRAEADQAYETLSKAHNVKLLDGAPKRLDVDVRGRSRLCAVFARLTNEGSLPC